MTDLELTIRAYFDDQGWPVQRHETEPLFWFDYGTDAGNWTCFLRFREGLNRVLIHSVHPEQAPFERIGDVAEFLHRVNCRQVAGGFDIDMGTGDIRYRTSVDFGRALPTVDLLDPAIKANLLAYARHKGDHPQPRL